MNKKINGEEVYKKINKKRQNFSINIIKKHTVKLMYTLSHSKKRLCKNISAVNL